MSILMSVKELMSHIEDGNAMWVTMITSCSGHEVYSNWYFNCPYEMKEHDVTYIKIEDKDHLILYIL